MTLHDTREAFGWMSIVTHRTVAPLILSLILSGPLLAAVPDGATRRELIPFHKHAGILAILSTLWRIAWDALEPETLPPVSREPSARTARLAMHRVLVGGRLIVEISGVLMSLDHGYDVPLPGLGAPPAQAEIAAVAAPARFLHGFVADLLLVAAARHAGAALKHHSFVDHDRTVARMFRRRG